MTSKKILGRLLATTVTILALLVAGNNPSYAGDTAACEFGANESSLASFESANCCACDGEAPDVECMTVRHNGVASCTFEFCSKSNCYIINGEDVS